MWEKFMKKQLSLLAVGAVVLFDSVDGMNSIKSSEEESESPLDIVSEINFTRSGNRKKCPKSRQVLIATSGDIKEKYNVSEVYEFVNSGYNPKTNIDACVNFYERFNKNLFADFLYREKVLDIFAHYSITRFMGDTDIKYTIYYYPKLSLNEEQMSNLFSKFCEKHTLFSKLINGFTKKEAKNNDFLKWFYPKGYPHGLKYEDEFEAWRQFEMFYFCYLQGWYSPYLQDDPALPYPPK